MDPLNKLKAFLAHCEKKGDELTAAEDLQLDIAEMFSSIICNNPDLLPFENDPLTVASKIKRVGPSVSKSGMLLSYCSCIYG